MSKDRAARPRPPLFRALGKDDPPAEVVVNGRAYAREEIYKHDSWAATAVYASGSGERIVCKFNRTQPACGVSMGWLGRRLAVREARALTRLADLPRFPRSLGPVFAGGRRLRNAIARTYIPGHPLGHYEAVGPNFFAELEESVVAMHARGISYVDLHKRENVIVGDDGHPYLVDFQVCYDVSHPQVRWVPGARWTFEQLCIADLYHLGKHARRSGVIPRDAAPKLPIWLHLHRAVAVPLRDLRRRLLVACGIRRGRGDAFTEAFAEDALRQRPSRAA